MSTRIDVAVASTRPAADLDRSQVAFRVQDPHACGPDHTGNPLW
jgi:hypothetical protein